jgi:hypothetical protein
MHIDRKPTVSSLKQTNNERPSPRRTHQSGCFKFGHLDWVPPACLSNYLPRLGISYRGRTVGEITLFGMEQIRAGVPGLIT